MTKPHGFLTLYCSACSLWTAQATAQLNENLQLEPNLEDMPEAAYSNAIGREDAAQHDELEGRLPSRWGGIVSAVMVQHGAPCV